ICTSTPLLVDNQFVAVINVVIDLARLSEFLSSIEVGKTGTVVVLNRDSNIMASPDPAAIEQQQNGMLPMLDQLGRSNKMLGVLSQFLSRNGTSFDMLSEKRQVEFTDSADGRAYFVTLAPLHFSDWVVATIIPASDFLATIDKNAKLLLIVL